MESMRSPFQGVLNIIRFNWHFYLVSLIGFAFFFFVSFSLEGAQKFCCSIFCICICIPTGFSLIASFYIYDSSNLYRFGWLDFSQKPNFIVNVSAGFDETSKWIAKTYSESTLVPVDFYDASKHTEVSIKRARKVYPIHPDAIQVSSQNLPLKSKSTDLVIAFLSVHEIRDQQERILFFQELERILTDHGKITVTEHLRDFPNFLAFNIGFFHFISRNSWIKVFEKANLIILEEIKTTPFITTFTLKKSG